SVADAFGNAVPGQLVSLALVGTGTLTGGGATATSASGVATFAGLSVNLVGSKQLTAASGALPTVTSAAFTVSPAAPASLAFTVQPAPALVNATIAPAVKVAVADVFGNSTPGASVALVLVGTGVLTGGGAVLADAAGVATFAALGVDRAGTFQVNATTGL